LAIELIDVDKKNWDFIMGLRNESYKNFYKQKKPLQKEEHYKYLEKQKSNPNFHHWLISYENKLVGYVRLLDNDVGIMIKNEFQNKGIASQVLKLMEDKSRDLGITKLIALVQLGNESSKKIFLKNDYKLTMYWLEKDIT